MDTIALTTETAAHLLISHEFRAMGSHMLAVYDGDAQQVNPLLAQVPQWFEEWEQIFSRFRPDSELSRLNQGAGREVPVSPTFWEVLQLALDAANQSGGLVTPATLDALVAAGYDRTFDDVLASGAGRDVVTSKPVPNWREIRLDPRKRTVLLPPGVRLDLGGIVKGWAADQAAARLGRNGPALVDAGGDIAVSGPLRDGSPWPIGVADPHAPDQQIALLAIKTGGVATSGRDYRRWRQNGKEAHHIIDPRTGQPAQTDVLSATVIGPSAAQAEVAAKAALILGSREGLRWLQARPEYAGLLALDNGRVLRSPNLSDYLWR